MRRRGPTKVSHTYKMPTIKALFGQATHCAYPGCPEPLVFEARGITSIAVDIAHIRSEKPSGPRYDAAYPEHLLNSNENLLLLCSGKHHRPVDQNESVYTTEELLLWKAEQVAQSGGTVVSDAQLTSLVRTLESSLSTLQAAMQVAVDVDAAGGQVVDGSVIAMPLEGLSQITIGGEANPRLLVGVKVMNKGAASTDVTSVGIDIDMGAPTDSYATWKIAGPWCEHPLPGYRLKGRSTEYWYVDSQSARAHIELLAKGARRVPKRFRPFADLGDDSRVEGEWRSTLLVPVWKPGTTEDDLDRLGMAERGGQSEGDDG